MDRRSLADYSPWGRTVSDMTEPLTLSCTDVQITLTPTHTYAVSSLTLSRLLLTSHLTQNHFSFIALSPYFALLIFFVMLTAWHSTGFVLLNFLARRNVL